MKSVEREERLSSRLSLQWKQCPSREDARRERNERKKERGKKEEEEGEKEKERERERTAGEGDERAERRKFLSGRKNFRRKRDRERERETETENAWERESVGEKRAQKKCRGCGGVRR